MFHVDGVPTAAFVPASGDSIWSMKIAKGWAHAIYNHYRRAGYTYRIITEGSINLNTHFLASQPARLFLILSSSLKSFCSWWSTIPCLLANRRHFWRYTLGSATRDHWCCQAPWFQQFHLRWRRSSSPTRHGDKATWHGNTKGSFDLTHSYTLED